MNTQNNTDYKAIEQTVLDYAEGIYQVDPSRIERSIHPDLTKGGFFKEEKETEYSFTAMTFTQMVELARNYNKDGRMPEDAPREITIFDTTDQIASAKLIAWWGIDYIHLAKYNDAWKIINVLWQTHPGQDSRLADNIPADETETELIRFEERIAKATEAIVTERERRLEEQMRNYTIDDYEEIEENSPDDKTLN